SAMTTQDSGARTAAALFFAPVSHPTRDSVRALALASVIANAVLVCTGTAAVVLHARAGEGPGPARPLVRASRVVLAGLAVQGLVGYFQSFSRLPAGLVWVHVSMSAVLWVLVLRLYLSTRERQPLPAVAITRAGPAPAARNPQAPGVAQGA